jgi:hypothetical protein
LFPWLLTLKYVPLARTCVSLTPKKANETAPLFRTAAGKTWRAKTDAAGGDTPADSIYIEGKKIFLSTSFQIVSFPKRRISKAPGAIRSDCGNN